MGKAQAYQRKAIAEPAIARPRRFVFLLLDAFHALDFNAAVEALNAANQIDDSRRYSWLVLSADGQPVHSSSGLVVHVDGPLQPLSRSDTVLVCGGENVVAASTLPVLNWLRRETRKGAVCGGIGGGAHTLALAGLLADKTVTIHWKHHDAFRETFPDIDLRKSVYATQGNRFTCAGGISTVDLMLDIISGDHGADIATDVADRLVYSTPRTGQQEQTLSILGRTACRNDKLATAIQLMRDNMEEPIPPAEIARHVGMSTRQLERLFCRYLGASPKKYYTKLRLETARNLLQQTNWKVIEIAMACGFNSPSHFSKVYRSHFGQTPYGDQATRSRN